MILTILKVIGIILLVILLIIILIFALVLFAPIKYRFAGEYFEEPDVYANIRYFPVALNAQVSYKDNKLEYTIKALGGVIKTNTNKKLSWLGRKLSSADNGDDVEDTGGPNKNEDGKSGINEDKNSNENNISEMDSVNFAGDNSLYIEKNEKANADHSDMKTDSVENKEKEKKKSNNKKSTTKKSFIDIIKEKKESLTGKYEEIRKKLSDINKKKDSLTKIYHSKKFEMAKADVIKYIKSLLNAIKPKHIEGNIHFGMDDPATTGEILGGLSLILPLYDSYITINPDFEKKVIEGILKGNGTIYLWSIVKIAIKVIFNKNLINVGKRVKTIIKA